MGLGKLGVINSQKFLPSGLKLKNFILTRRDLSSPSLQKFRWMARNVDSTKRQLFSEPGQVFSGPGWACSMSTWNQESISPNPPRASGDVDFLFFQKMTSRPWGPLEEAPEAVRGPFGTRSAPVRAHLRPPEPGTWLRRRRLRRRRRRTTTIS